LFIILQQNIEFIKVEHDVGVLSEEDSTGMKTDELYIPPPFSMKMAEPEVSLYFVDVYVYVLACAVEVTYNMTCNSEHADNSFICMNRIFSPVKQL
jgi:hypothetical protein